MWMHVDKNSKQALFLLKSLFSRYSELTAKGADFNGTLQHNYGFWVVIKWHIIHVYDTKENWLERFYVRLLLIQRQTDGRPIRTHVCSLSALIVRFWCVTWWKNDRDWRAQMNNWSFDSVCLLRRVLFLIIASVIQKWEELKSVIGMEWDDKTL